MDKRFYIFCLRFKQHTTCNWYEINQRLYIKKRICVHNIEKNVVDTNLISYLHLAVKTTSFDSYTDYTALNFTNPVLYPNYLTIYVAPTDTDVTLAVHNGSSYITLYNIPNGFTWNGDIPAGLRYKITGATFTVGLGVKK